MVEKERPRFNAEGDWNVNFRTDVLEEASSNVS
jgi:hypothetical protein